MDKIGKKNSNSNSLKLKPSKNNTHDQEIRRLSPGDAPVLFKDKYGTIIAGFMLETQDVINETIHLTGWLIGSPDMIFLHEGREVDAEIECISRNDVLEAFPTSSNFSSGFKLKLPKVGVGNYVLRWQLSYEGKSTPVDFHLAEIDVVSLNNKSKSHGVVDRLHDMVFEGWAQDPSSPDNHISVEFLINETVIGEVICNIFRQDLRQAGIGNGDHGFRWPVPEKMDPLMASQIKVRIKDSNTILSSNLTPTFSSLVATRCFEGDIDFSWPYYISGVIAPRTRSVPDYLEFISGDDIVATVDIVQDLDVKSLTYGAGRFSWEVPVTLVNDPAAPVRIRLPGCGILDIQAERSAADIAGGTFSVVDNVIKGHVTLIQQSNLRTISLKIVIGHEIGGYVDVEFKKDCKGEFSFAIPHNYLTAEELFIGVITKAGHVPLRTESGQLEYCFHPTAFGMMDDWKPPYILGWAVDNSAIDNNPEVQLYDGEKLIGKAFCTIERVDVNRMIKRTGTFGFEVPVPEWLFSGKAIQLHIRCGGVKLRIGGKCDIPKMLTIHDLKKILPANRIKGRVEQLTTELVAGWAWDVMRPETPVDLVIRVDGQAVGTVHANKFSSRLRGNGRSGHQQFIFRLPICLQNGSKRHVAVEEANTRFELPNKVSPISFPLVVMEEPDRVAKAWNYSSIDLATAQKQGYVRYVGMHAVGRRVDHSSPKISMIALNWNGDLMIEDFLSSIERNQPAYPYELLIVDHGSVDNSISIIKQFEERLPIRLIERRANYSFSASNNYAANLATGEYLLFLNNDLILQHDCASTMADLLSDSDVGVVGARLLEPIKDDKGNWFFEPHHEGVRFKIDALPETGAKYYAPQEITGVPVELSRSALEMPVVTAALMICRKVDFLAVGGFSEEYFYGLEDVDLCLKFGHKLGKKVICDLSSCAVHNRSATRDSKFAEKQSSKFYTSDIHAKNRTAYIRRFGRQLGKKILRSLLDSSSFFRQQALRVTFVVTESDINTAAGDYFTALELGIWLRKKFGWEVFFITIGNYLIPNTDVIVVMRHDYDIRKLVGGNPGLITVAWVRNRTDEWLARPEFDAYNIVFASSQKMIDYLYDVRKRKVILMPIATNPERFSPEMADPEHTSDVVFTGSYHGAVRGAVAMMNLENATYNFAIYGYNWEKYSPFVRYSRGSLRYDLLARAYASSKLVIDDSHPVTREWNSLNSRIFDAIACGKVVITNCVEGARELFDHKLPTFSTRDELNRLIDNLLQHNEKREQLAQELRDIVLEKHTYANRADTFKEGLVNFLKEDSMRFAIKIGVPRRNELEQWGDYHFALGIKRALERKGHFARIDILPEWEGGLCAYDDVVIVLRGLSRYKPQPMTINLMWLISHPDEVSIAEMREYDHVFIASDSYATRLKDQLGDKVSTLLQCTDPHVFYPDVDETLELPEVLFVGNSRGQRREVVQHALDTNIDFGVFGGGWQNILPSGKVLGDYIPNSELRRYYSSAKVLLNDHWPDMRKEGFISNRIFDAGACGARILTDSIIGLKNLFSEYIFTYDTIESFGTSLHKILNDKKHRSKTSTQLSRIILSNHTFDHRINEVISLIKSFNNIR